MVLNRFREKLMQKLRHLGYTGFSTNVLSGFNPSSSPRSYAKYPRYDQLKVAPRLQK